MLAGEKLRLRRLLSAGSSVDREIAFDVMPWRPTSFAMARTKPAAPALAAEYATSPASPTRPASETMVTTLPGASFDHPRQGDMRAIHDALQIGPKISIPVLAAALSQKGGDIPIDRFGTRVAGIVHEQRDRSERRLRPPASRARRRRDPLRRPAPRSLERRAPRSPRPRPARARPTKSFTATPPALCRARASAMARPAPCPAPLTKAICPPRSSGSPPGNPRRSCPVAFDDYQHCRIVTRPVEPERIITWNLLSGTILAPISSRWRARSRSRSYRCCRSPDCMSRRRRTPRPGRALTISASSASLRTKRPAGSGLGAVEEALIAMASADSWWPPRYSRRWAQRMQRRSPARPQLKGRRIAAGFRRGDRTVVVEDGAAEFVLVREPDGAGIYATGPSRPASPRPTRPPALARPLERIPICSASRWRVSMPRACCGCA